jgi:hypothetical protein
VRKSQEMVERDKCNILTGITLSSEALAVAPKLDEWNAIFLSSDNGDGKLTGLQSSSVAKLVGAGAWSRLDSAQTLRDDSKNHQNRRGASFNDAPSATLERITHWDLTNHSTMIFPQLLDMTLHRLGLFALALVAGGVTGR